MQFLTDDIEEYIKDLIEKFKEQNIYQPIVDSLSKQMFAPEQTNDFDSKLNQNLSAAKPLEGYVTNNRILNDPSKPIFIENDYKHSPTIQNQPSPVITPALKHPVEDILKPSVQNAINTINEKKDKVIDWAKNEKDILLNNKIDYSKPMIPHEKITDWGIKNLGKYSLPVSSDMYTDGMTDFSRAKQNPNAEIINFKDVKDEKMQDILKQYQTKEDERGVHYNTGSKASELFSKSKEIQDFFKDNKEDIKQGKIKEKSFEFGINQLKDLKNDIDRFASVQHGTLLNPSFDKDNNGTGTLIDNSDFEWRDSNKYGKIPAWINNHGYNMQEKGNYENHFSVIDILAKEKEDEEKESLIKKLLRFFYR